jgi:hypothetical protein
MMVLSILKEDHIPLYDGKSNRRQDWLVISNDVSSFDSVVCLVNVRHDVDSTPTTGMSKTTNIMYNYERVFCHPLI